jgi:hypothetical protein
MLIEEADWINQVMEKHFSKEDFPLLNVGSSTESFRKETQPFIHEEIFLPLIKKGFEVLHTDLKKEEGVDIDGDLNSKEFRAQLKSLNIKSVLCSNLLEHLEKPQEICDSILDILPSGGKLIITVPNSFPYHKDPIDTMLRPNIHELHAFFPNTSLVKAEVVVSNNCYKDSLVNNWKYLLTMIVRWLLPFYKFKEWRHMIKDLFQANKKYKATCLVLQKK